MKINKSLNSKIEKIENFEYSRKNNYNNFFSWYSLCCFFPSDFMQMIVKLYQKLKIESFFHKILNSLRSFILLKIGKLKEELKLNKELKTIEINEKKNVKPQDLIVSFFGFSISNSYKEKLLQKKSKDFIYKTFQLLNYKRRDGFNFFNSNFIRKILKEKLN